MLEAALRGSIKSHRRLGLALVVSLLHGAWAEALSAQVSPGQSSPGQSSPGQSSPGQSSPGQSSPAQGSPAQGSSAPADALRSLAGQQAWSHGELGAQARELQTAWSASARVTRLSPRLLERGDTFDLWVPESLLDPHREDCVTIAALSMPNLSFLLFFEDEDLDPKRRAWPIPSAAGLAEVSRCGARKPLLRALAAKMRSRRGVVEFLIAQSEHPPEPAADLLRGRNPGPTIASPQVGQRPALGPLKLRLAQKTRMHRQSGAEHVMESGVPTDEHGRGTLVVHLEKGCHVIEVLAESNPQAPPDIDAQLSALIVGEQIASDEEQSGQAKLIHCVGRPERFRVEFTGATPQAEVTILRARYPLPDGIPTAWGPVAGANLARALFDLRLPRVAALPSFSTLGVRGTTAMVVELEAYSCSIVAVAPIRGEVQRLALAAQWGIDVRENQTLESYGGTAMSLCVGESPRLRLEVQASGESLAWILGVWPIASQRPGGP